MLYLFNRLIVFFAGFLPKAVVRKFARKYIAGDALDDAVAMVKTLNANGAMATLDVLGEEIHNLAEARVAVTEYKKAVHAIHEHGLDCNISLKPTQFGLGLDVDVAEANIREVVEEARRVNIFVRIDMEDARYTTATYQLYLSLKNEYKNVGTVMQAYLRRSYDDLLAIMDKEINLRLCKGIYVEDRKIAHKDPEIINRNFVQLLELMLRAKHYVGIATHDERLVYEGMRLIREFQLSRNDYEFQMLLGVDEQLRDIIISAGHRLRVYVPYGINWYQYSMRRLRENPQLAGHTIRNVLGIG